MTLFLGGSGGFARETVLVLGNCSVDGRRLFPKKEIRYLTDDESQWGQKLLGIKVDGSIESVEESGPLHSFLPAVGSPKLKQSFVARAEARGWRTISYIEHLQSFIGDAKIGNGTIICSMCSITTNVTIGKYVNVNLNCTIGHDVVIEDYVNLSPHCTISGHVHIKKGADIGSAVSILPGVTIGENSIIGAGAVILSDVPDNVVVVAKGVKGQVIKEI